MILLLFVIVIVIILAVISTFLSTICSKVGIIVITTVSLKHDGTDSENQVYGHFGTKTLRHRCIVMLVNGGSYVVYGEGSLKQSTFMCHLL